MLSFVFFVDQVLQKQAIDSKLDREFQPSENEPLVYHLLGIDTEPSSIVLTEDDYFDFLEKAPPDLGHIVNPANPAETGFPNIPNIPPEVRRALANSLLMLGYNLYHWDFRVVFHGALKRMERRVKSLMIQFKPGLEECPEEREKIHQYLEKYFGVYEFEIIWNDVDRFTQNLWDYWRR